MHKTIFQISKMDCASEENLLRMKLAEIPEIENLDFNLANRTLTVYHEGKTDEIEQAIQSLNLGCKKLSSEKTEHIDFEKEIDQRKLLWTVLAINFTFFVIEITTGLLSKSMGLVADSLDMLADAFVYGISLLAVGSTVVRKKKIARLAGYFQLVLAVVGFAEVLRRFLGMERLPDFSTMIIVSAFALLANAICLYLLQHSKSKHESHMKASMIFTSNDVIINLGVLAAGLLVNWLNSGYPDLIIGAIVFVLVIQGAIRILKLGK
ncbi:MAG: cation transporter [Bacteroidia bacterium]